MITYMESRKMGRILLDADALVALALVGDTNREKAINIVDSFEDDEMVVTQFTIPEVVTVLSKKATQRIANDFLIFLRQKNYFEFGVDQFNKKMADEIFLKQNKKGTSWIDCFNAAVYRLEKLDAIFSFDRFYKRVGAKVIA